MTESMTSVIDGLTLVSESMTVVNESMASVREEWPAGSRLQAGSGRAGSEAPGRGSELERCVVNRCVQ